MGLNENCYEPWTELCAASDIDFEAAFARYASTVLIEFGAGRLTIDFVGRHLAKALFLPLISNHAACEAVAQYGGLLEVPRPGTERSALLAKINTLLDEIKTPEK